MKRSTLYILAFGISILGLSIIQYKYLEIGLNLAKVQFSRKIGTAGQAIQSGLESENQLTVLVASALIKDNSFFTLSIDSLQDSSSHFLNDFITEQLVNEGIDAEFAYTLITRDTGYYLRSPLRFKEDDQVISYPIALKGYLPGKLEKPISLELQFKDLNTYFLSQLNGLTLPSLLFILGIIVAVVWALRTYYWQRGLIITTNDFINNLTHELKTPVFSIGLATKILNQKATEEQKPVLDIIRQQAGRLSHHIDKVLELGNMEIGSTMFTLAETDFRPGLLKLCEEFDTLVSMEKVVFSYSIDPGPFKIRAEVFHLENSINNILDNAKKYSRDPKISLNAGKRDHQLFIEIRDQGQGIDKKDQKRIFEKFYRVPSGDLHRVKGYGLGLSYVRQVMDKHRGTIQIKSEKGQGTTVTLSIPLSHV
ncbi:MAG TPA: HAMP domain-containing sensor histidine kinase [Eudoraea sp.]|nr:HAMP domain-containing sensor histidine kinase [Eudoraea sp.]